MNDKAKMIEFVSHHLNDEGERIVLSQGASRKEDIIVDVMVLGDELVIESNCPKEESDWINVKEIYHHVRWRTMPAWEQKEWLRATYRRESVAQQTQLDAFGDSLAEKIVSRLQSSVGLLLPTKRVETNLAPYRFQKVGTFWHIHFQVGDKIKVAQIPDSVRWRQMACLLYNKNIWVPSETLAGNDDLESLGLIAADRTHRSEPRFGNLTVETLQSVLQDKQDRLESARMCGDVDAASKAEDEFESFKKNFGETQKDFRRLISQREGNQNLAKSFHESVRKNRLRLLSALRNTEYKMQECADYLEMTVQPEGCGFAYRPPSPAIDWIL